MIELIDKNKLLSILEEEYDVYYCGHDYNHNFDIAYGIELAIEAVNNQKVMIMGIDYAVDYAACNNSKEITKR